MTEQESELVDAIAEVIMARSGVPYRDQAVAVLVAIEDKGWRLVPPAEGDRA